MPTPRQQIDAWKARLLDLSRRNRMLHTRPGVGGTVALSYPDALKLFDALVRRRRLAFATSLTLEERLAVLRWGAPATGATVRLDTIAAPLPKEGQLATDLLPADQERALYTLRLRARTALGEGGVNVLFVALGFLEWFDRDSPELVMRSPLLLVPVELLREKNGDEYALRLLDDEIALNPTLAHKLRQDYGIELPALPEDDDELQLDQLFATLGELVARHDGWRVQPECTLGLFSFLKLMLYHDLERAAEIAPTHPVLSLLTGGELGIENVELRNSAVQQGQAVINKAPAREHNRLSQFSILNSHLDQRPPEQCYQILDADASQAEAIEAARGGGSFILQGPPGTGKSQTIANIIAECLAQGRRVLFVSEKMAALDVVYERLRQCGLAEFCLELHSHKARVRAVLDALGGALDAPSAPPRPGFPYDELTALRDQLNGYARALHTPLGPLGWTAYNVHSRIALFADAPESEQPNRDSLELTPEQFGAVEALLVRLDARRDMLAHMPANVWRGCAITTGSFEARGRIRARGRALLSALADLQAAAAHAAAQATLPAPATLADARALAALAALLREPHAAPANWLDDATPGSDVARQLLLDEARDRYAALAADEAQLLARYRPAVLELELDALAMHWRGYASWTRLLRPRYYEDAALLRGALAPGAAPEDGGADIALARAVRDARRWEAENAPALAAQLGPCFEGRATRWGSLGADADWFARVQALPLPAPLSAPLAAAVTEVSERPALLAALAPLEAILAKLETELAFIDELDIENQHLKKEAIANTECSMLNAQCSMLLERMGDLDEWWELCELRRAAAPLGLAPFLDQIAGAEPHPAAAAPRRSFHRRLCQLWLDAAHEQLPALRAFGRDHHEALVARFRQLDAAQLSAAQARLRQVLAARRPPVTAAAPSGELATLRRELQKQRRHKPIRQLFGEIPALLGQLKPCLLMSPLSVSQFLEPDAPPFDLLIFDEASQIRTEDAIGAIMRARNVVVVGDNRQLPPTSFFLAGDDSADDAEADAPDRFESILDACAAAGLPPRLLRWHYRSRHESLIAFSNASFYANRLATFPAASVREGQGVRFEHVPEGRYDRRNSRANRIEAQRVVDLIWQHGRTTPAQSLGVVAFSQSQQLAILHELEARRAADPSLEALFDEARPEALFVKNLENVQGDERDAIIVSVGYGRDEAGKLLMNFGPLNQAGGERRLNVAITRARERLTLVSSIGPEEIDLKRTQHPGPRLLRAFMEYARRRGPEPLAAEATPPQGARNPLPQRFEDQLAAALAAEGLALRRQVGHSDFRIDIALCDPADPQRFLLGVECDGDDYRDAATARDRERLREQVLENLGWKLHRAWSAAWAVDSEGEIGRVLEAVAKVKG